MALIGWVTGFWWCEGRWGHGVWLQWIVLPAFVLNADHVWALWKDWFGILREGWRYNLWWFALFSLLEWQFWVTGFRTRYWWDGAGSGKDFAVLAIVISAFVLLAQSPKGRERLWLAVIAVATLAIAMSVFIFYRQYGISEERFRLVWRYRPGFNAVTTGILVGFALVASWGPWIKEKRIPVGICYLVFAFLGFALAASESRGALLGVLVAAVTHLGKTFFLERTMAKRKMVTLHATRRLLVSGAGFLVYWLLALVGSQASKDDLVTRGSAGRFEIYESYLGELSSLDWIVGKGEVPVLPPEVLGWLVHHPHSSYCAQLVGYGLIGLVGLLLILAIALWKVRRCAELPLLLFGLTVCLFDGGQILSLFSIARWEALVVLVPLIVAYSSSQQEAVAESVVSPSSSQP